MLETFIVHKRERNKQLNLIEQGLFEIVSTEIEEMFKYL